MKILIVRMSAMGDIVMASPLLNSLKSLDPNCEIHWAVQPEFADVLKGHESIDHLVIVPKGRWKKAFESFQWLSLWREIKELKTQLRSENYDLAIDLQGLAKSGLIVKWSQASRKLGLNSREGSERWMDEVIEGNTVDGSLISSEYQAVAKALGDHSSNFKMSLPKKLSAPKSEEFRNHNSKYIVFCPFTTRPQKHWFNDAWQDLAQKFQDKTIIILGGPSDVDASKELMENMPTQVISLVGQTRIQDAIDLIRHSEGVIGVDTGLTHMGIAENKPTLALFGSTLPYSNTRHENAKVLYHKMDCSPCRRNPTCKGRFDCMRAISSEEVYLAWVELNS